MWNIIANRPRTAGVKMFVCDTTGDLENIDISNSKQGSTAFIIADSSNYMLNGEKTWVKVAITSRGSSSSDSKSDTEVEDEYEIVDGGTASE